MPRTFSRGTRFDATTLLAIHDRWLTSDQVELFDRVMRTRLCPEPEIEEIDVLQQLLELMELMQNLRRFILAHVSSTSIIAGFETNEMLLVRGWILEAFNVTSGLISDLGGPTIV